MLIECTQLTSDFVKPYLDRKKEGRLSLLVDVRLDKAYVVPVHEEHTLVALEILHAQLGDLQADPSFASHIVPVHIEFVRIQDELLISCVLTGVSGLEMGYHVCHTSQQLQEAHTFTLLLIDRSEMSKSDDFETRILYAFLCDNQQPVAL